MAGVGSVHHLDKTRTPTNRAVGWLAHALSYYSTLYDNQDARSAPHST